MSITVTERTLKLIDQHYGFDNYILQVSDECQAVSCSSSTFPPFLLYSILIAVPPLNPFSSGCNINYLLPAI